MHRVNCNAEQVRMTASWLLTDRWWRRVEWWSEDRSRVQTTPPRTTLRHVRIHTTRQWRHIDGMPRVSEKMLWTK